MGKAKEAAGRPEPLKQEMVYSPAEAQMPDLSVVEAGSEGTVARVEAENPEG